MPHQPRLRQRFAARLVYVLVRCISATVRYELDDDSGFFRSVPPERLIFAIWHNRLALSLMIYRRYVGKRAPERRPCGSRDACGYAVPRCAPLPSGSGSPIASW